MIGKEKNILPDFPRTRHLPYKPNTAHGDTIASEKEAAVIFQHNVVYDDNDNMTADSIEVTVEEKIDGANTGFCLFEGNPIIRNRNHILNKAFTQRRTAAKMQFASIFNWFYANMQKFERLNEYLGFEAAVYGEWMYAAHGLNYDNLPDLWIPYDIYDWQADKFLSVGRAREAFDNADLVPTPLLCESITSYEQLEELCQQTSAFSTTQKREGVYIKVSDRNNILHRFKMVREGFLQGGLWKDDQITRNKVQR